MPSARLPTSVMPPEDDAITLYDRLHFTQYLQLLDAQAMGLAWTEAAVRILALDMTDAAAARRSYCANLARARWMTSRGYRHLLK
jgi:Uncharacterized conserved protein (DUF2285)